MLLLLSSWLIHVPMTMRLCNSRLLEEHFVCYQMSQRNWVIIKVLYRCLWWCLLSWHRSRLGFITPIVGEVSLGPLGNAHHISLASITTNELVAIWCITKWVKRLAGNEIELGIEIPSSISLPENLFTRSVMHHPATNSLVTLLARLIVMCITERAQRYLSDNRSDKS